MTESPGASDDIQDIRIKIHAIEATQVLLVRDRAASLLEEFLQLFKAQPGLDAIYKAVDGHRTQADIVTHLGQSGSIRNHSQPTISRRMEILVDNGLIEAIESTARGTVYEKNRIVERVLRLSKKLERI